MLPQFGRYALGSFAKHQAQQAIDQSRYDWTFSDRQYGPELPTTKTL